MIRYLNAADLRQRPLLARTMFRSRAQQFSERLNWEVCVDEWGGERDQYDTLDPIYVIWELPDGSHGGSLRFLPTTGRTMLAEHFSHLLKMPVIGDRIWECTRFCLAPGAKPGVSASLLLGALILGLRQGWTHSVGVFDARMAKVYSRIGWSPKIIASDGVGKRAMRVGLWSFEERIQYEICSKYVVPQQVIPIQTATDWRIDHSAAADGPQPPLKPMVGAAAQVSHC